MFAEPAFAAVSEESSVVWENGYITLSSEIITMWVLIALIGIIGYLGTRKLKMIPTGLQNVLEYTIEGFTGFFESILGRERARTFGPYLFTFFILILFSNYVGLLPLAGHLPGYKPPTSNLSVTAALALKVFKVLLWPDDSGQSFRDNYQTAIPRLASVWEYLWGRNDYFNLI